MAKSARIRKSTRYALESLESRLLLAANLHVTGVSMVDANGNPAPSPTVGMFAYVRISRDYFFRGKRGGVPRGSRQWLNR